MESSIEMQKYFENIEKEVKNCYKIASEVKLLGYDPSLKVTTILAKNLSERVEGIISVLVPQVKNSGIAERIVELESIYGMQDWRIAMIVALEVAQEKFCKFKDKKEAMEIGIRVGFSYVTNGVVSSPIEGFIGLEIRKTLDGKDYFSPQFAGPIRSAGGTAASVSVLIVDYVRKHMGYAKYDPTEDEIQRVVSEVHFFHERITNLQYLPSEKELYFLASNLPVQIDGDPSEKIETPRYKDLLRVPTNKLRNGFCLVMAECLSLKAEKVWKQLSRWGKEMEMEHWSFMEEFVKVKKEVHANVDGKKEKKEMDKTILKDYTYIKDLVAGRPIIGHPSRHGAFRLRLGRARTSGLSSDAIHPCTMVVLDDYFGIGTQLRTERPGKSTTLTSCDKLDGPIVKLKNGNVLYLDDFNEAKKIRKEIEEIIYLGDILISYGDMLNRAHSLMPVGYNEEWWSLQLEKSLTGDEKLIFKDFINNPFSITFDDSLKLSLSYKIPLHPKYTFHYNAVDFDSFFVFLEWLSKAVIQDNKIIFPLSVEVKKEIDKADPKRVLELFGVPHVVATNEFIVVEGDPAKALQISFNCKSGLDFSKIKILLNNEKTILENINLFSLVEIKDKSGHFIGTRMGRPEKAKMRKLIGSPHILFPVGDEGGRFRCFSDTLNVGKVTADFSCFFCVKCSKEVIYSRCPFCDSLCKQVEVGEKNGRKIFFRKNELPINDYFSSALKRLGFMNYPELIKGVRGTSNKDHSVERLEKGILRAKHNLYVNRDGTIRYDMTELVITHFKPKEIGTSVLKLREMGYIKDIYGKKLVDSEQILELKLQDIILPSCPDSIEEGADEILFRIANFVDECLEKLYCVKSFYNLKTKADLIGHLVVGLAPHIAAGSVCRIIGFTKTQGFFAHPVMHCAFRRDADGDEAAIILLMDMFLNFDSAFLSNRRGSTQDEPLVLSYNVIPAEVDDMVFDLDTVWRYPLELYEACEQYKKPWEVKIERFGDRLGTASQFEGLGFTHDTNDLNLGVLCSSYKTIPTMMEKVKGQMIIAEKLRAVDENDVARLIIERHFMRDIKGNLRKFSQQTFRCVKCNEIYRRPPLKGICLICSGKLVFTVSEGSIVKYLGPSLSLAESYDLPPYLKQTLFLVKKRIEDVFGAEKDKQEGLGKWFG